MPTFPLEPGIYRDVPKDAYHADPCATASLSSSIAGTLIMQSPAHAWHAHPKGGGASSGHTAATANGTLFDSLLLGGDTEIVIVTADDWRTKAAREARDEAHACGKLAVLEREANAAKRKVEIIRSRLRDAGVELDGESQLTIVWDEPVNGLAPVRCRGRLDHWKAGLATIYDLKCLRSAAPRDVARAMVSYGYDIQAAAYTRAVESLFPDLAGRVRFVLLAVETEEPFAVLPAHPDGTMRELGQRRWKRAVDAWANGLATGIWPGYSSGEVEVSAPPWALQDEMPEGGSPGVSF